MGDRGSGQNTGGGILHATGIQTIQIIPPIHFRAPPLFIVVLKNLLSVCLYFVYFPPGILLLCTFHLLDVLRRVATDVTIYVPWPHPNFVCNVLIHNLLITSCLLCSKAVNIAADYSCLNNRKFSFCTLKCTLHSKHAVVTINFSPLLTFILLQWIQQYSQLTIGKNTILFNFNNIVNYFPLVWLNHWQLCSFKV